MHYACAPLHVYLWCGEIDLALSYMFPCKDLLGLGTLAVGMTWIYLNYTVTMKTTQQNSMLPISDPPLKLRADIWIHSCHSPQTRTDAHFALRNPFCQRIRILQQHSVQWSPSTTCKICKGLGWLGRKSHAYCVQYCSIILNLRLRTSHHLCSLVATRVADRVSKK